MILSTYEQNKHDASSTIKELSCCRRYKSKVLRSVVSRLNCPKRSEPHSFGRAGVNRSVTGPEAQNPKLVAQKPHHLNPPSLRPAPAPSGASKFLRRCPLCVAGRQRVLRSIIPISVLDLPVSWCLLRFLAFFAVLFWLFQSLKLLVFFLFFFCVESSISLPPCRTRSSSLHQQPGARLDRHPARDIACSRTTIVSTCSHTPNHSPTNTLLGPF